MMVNDVSPPDRFWPLVEAACLGTFSEDEYCELQAIMRGNSAIQQLYLDYCRMHSELRLLCGIQRANDAVSFKLALPACQPAIVVLNRTFPIKFQNTLGYSSSSWPMAYLVATVIFGIGLAIGAITHVSHHVQIAVESPTDAKIEPTQIPSMPSVGQVTGMVDCNFSDPSTLTFSGAHVSIGRKYALSSGLMEITYDSGAKVILQGPCNYEVTSADSGHLSIGRLTARVEKKVASGQWSVDSEKSPIPNPSLATSHSPLFTISTPTATVTDLGTEFGVVVSKEQLTQVHVLQGAVNACAVNMSGETQSSQRVNEGCAVEIESGSKQIRARRFTPRCFVCKLHSTANLPVNATYKNVVLADNPIGYWRLGEVGGVDSINVAAQPRSSSQIAMAADGVVLGNAPGVLAADTDRAATFVGKKDAWIGVNDSSSFNFNIHSPFTIEAWFKTSYHSVQGIVAKDNHNAGTKQAGAGYFVCLTDFGLGYGPYFQLESGNTYLYRYAGGGLNDGKWHHLVVTYDGGANPSSLGIFVDGSKLPSEATQFAGSDEPLGHIENTEPLRIGGRHNDMWFRGVMDEVAVYRGVLSDATIARHFQAAFSEPFAQRHIEQDRATADSNIHQPSKTDAIEMEQTLQPQR